ncbi:MAG: hypothetical protein KF841_06440 [Phycisphaerae bacterium]|nr:hypothetical protein [Phycisphaerae bacterium]
MAKRKIHAETKIEIVLTMPDDPRKSIVEIANELGRYAVDAFEFLTEGLDYTVRKIHGPTNQSVENVARWIRENEIDPDDLEALLDENRLPQAVVSVIESVGGAEEFRQKLNRHVEGSELCWGLRDLALEKWGAMAPAVLNSWGIFRTLDFGRMVFALVENNLLQKQPEDRIEDFQNVFDFEAAFKKAYRIALPGSDE